MESKIKFIIFSVFLSQKDGKDYALKFIDKDLIIQEDLAQNIKTELNLMKSIKHPYIVKLFEVLSSAQKIIIVMEYVEGGDLFDEIKRGEGERLSEEKSRYIFQQIITALEYCHSKNIIHRDLKPENILFDAKENCIKISDFGLATILQEKDEKLSDFCGTTNYIAPEIIKETGKIFSSGGYNGQPADIWSAGVILYNMVSGENPFYHSDKAISINNILNANIDYPKYFSKSLVDLLTKIFVTQPKLRYTIENIKKHPWFLKNYTKERVFMNDNDPSIAHVMSLGINTEFYLEEDKIPYANCFILTSILTGKWMSNMFKEEKSERVFDMKDHYEWHCEGPLSKLEAFLAEKLELRDENKVRTKQSKKGIWSIEATSSNKLDKVKYEMIVYKIEEGKYIIIFEYKEGSKAIFFKKMKNLNEKKSAMFKQF